MHDASLTSTCQSSRKTPCGDEIVTAQNLRCCERCKTAVLNKSATNRNATTLSYGLIILLFMWNFVLWMQVKEIQNEVLILKLNGQDSQAENQLPPSFLSGIDAADPDNELQKSSKFHSAEYTGRALKDFTAEESDFTSNDNSNGILRRIKRSAGRKGGKSVRRKKRRRDRPKRSKCISKRDGKSSENPLSNFSSQATAIHVAIGGRRPYRGIVMGGADGVIRQWRASDLWNQGFDVSNLNSTSSSAGVVVKKPGVYYFYSQITFTLQAGIEFHEKIEIGMRGRMELASCVNSRPDVSGPSMHTNDKYITCHSSGIARMERGWSFGVRIYPNNQNIYVYNNPHYTYFGAFLIGNAEH